MKMMTDKITALAVRFALNLLDEIGDDNFAEMKKKNKTPAYRSGCCASHDYVDANMVMAFSFREIMKEDMDTLNDSHLTTWNKAWVFAKEQELI